MGELTLADLVASHTEELPVESVPLHDKELQKIERKVTYKQIKKDLKEWDGLVQHNRQSRILDLPFQKDKGNNVTIASLSCDFKATNDFEEALMELEKSTGMNEKTLSYQDELKIQSIEEEDVKERIRDLRRLRELTFRTDTKNKRHKKIKSRKYRKILSKEKMRTSVKTLTLDQLKEVSGEYHDTEQLTTQRAEERLTLRHKHLGKWSKMIKKRGAKDPVTRKAIAEQLERHEELKMKMGADESELKELEPQGDKPGQFDDLMDLEFMNQSLPEPQSDSEDSFLSEDSHEEILLKSPIKATSLVNPSQVLEKLNQNFHFKVPDAPSSMKKQSRVMAQVVNGSEVEQIAAQPDNEDLSSESTQMIIEDKNDNPWISRSLHNDDKESFTVDPSVELKIAPHQTELINEAFKEDSLTKEFEQEKIDLEQEEGDKIIDITLPGWGSWSGLNAKPKEMVKTKIEKGVTKRRDSKRENVIIREKQSKLLQKYVVHKTPFPFKSAKAYEQHLNQPNGKEWNTYVNYSKLNKPRIQTHFGKLIEPLQLHAKNSMKKSE